MRSRAVRVTLTLLAIAAIGTAAYYTWVIEAREMERRAALDSFNHTLRTALHAAFDLRTAQQAYVAAGQSEAYWFDKSAGSLDKLRESIELLRASNAVANVHAPLDEAADALEKFERIDRRARGYAGSGQKLLASDLIFGDGVAAATRIVSSLEQAGATAIEESALSGSQARREQLVPIGAGTGAVLFVLLLLTPAATGAPREPSAEPVSEEAHRLDLRLRQPVDANPAPSTVPVRPPRVDAPASAGVQLQALAEICNDLARLADTDQLPSLIERAARTLDASGLVLWVADPEGNELVPVATHGYATSVLSRLGTIRTEAENVTAAAFRTGLLQSVAPDGNAHGAIAAPLLTASGCRGVLSVEVKELGAHRAVRLAAASIFAAQLAALVGPAPDAGMRSEDQKNTLVG